MSRLRCRAGLAAVVLAGAVAMSPSTAGAAPPAPLGGLEWWFDAWRVYDMWAQTKGAGMTVAVVESGVNAGIPELAGAVLPGVDLVSGGNGQHDYTANGHGTAMAAHIVGTGTGTGMRGIAPDVRILPVVINHQDPPHYERDVVARGIRWAVDNGVNIVSLSIGATDIGGDIVDGCSADVQDAVRYAVQHNVVVIAGAGNDGDTRNSVYAPASCRGVLAVGAVDRQARPWVKSERQSYVDVAAPGVDMRSVNAQGQRVKGSGTSDATALTSAAVALVWSKHRDLTARQVVARLLYTVRDRPPGGTKDPQRGYGTLVPYRALIDDIPADAPNPVFDELAPATPAPTTGAAGEGESGGSAASGDSVSGGGIPVPVLVVGGVGVAAVLVLLAMLAARRRTGPGAPSSYYVPSPTPYGQQPPRAPPRSYPQQSYPQQPYPPQQPPPNG